MNKQFIKIFLFGLLVFSPVSCYKEELTLVPDNAIIEENYWTSESNAEAALIPMYRGRTFWRWTCFAFEYYGDAAGSGMLDGTTTTVSAKQCAEGTVTADNDFADLSYNEIYIYIIQANIVLKNIDKVTFKNPARKEAAKAEARFIRAMYYYHLTMIYGSVPNITDFPIPLYPRRATPEENWTQIITDLEWAIDNLPERNIGVLKPGQWECRPDKFSAKALLAKVLMSAPESLQDIPRAVTLLDEVINSGYFQLEPFYGDLMMIDNKDNPENVFMISFTGKMSWPFDGSNMASWSLPNQVWLRPTPEFYDKFEPGDTRRDVNIEYITIFKKHYVRKLRYDPRSYAAGVPNDNYAQYILRLADVYLLKAEALTRLDYEANKAEICNLVELVRNRAFQGAAHKVYAPADFASQHDFWIFLWWERRKEFFCEVHTFFDAKRMGLMGEMLGLEKFREVFPYSTNNLTLNPSLEQNPGY